MGISPERNDVDYSKLFKWTGEYPVKDMNGEDIGWVFVRILGDGDLNRARVMALRKSAELRKKLSNPDSDERVAYVADFEVLGREKIEAWLVLAAAKESYSKVNKDINIPFPKDLADDATLEQQEKWQALVDSYPERVRAQVEEEIGKVISKEKERAANLSDSALYKEYVEAVINDLCTNEMYDKFMDYCAYFGCYSSADYKERFFKELSDFEDLPAQMKQQFKEFYHELEIDIDDLKK